MKVAFSGAAGTGKTTVAEILAEATGIVLIPEGVREWLAEHGHESLRDLSPAQQFEMQKYLLDKKVKLETAYNNFIADRSSIDNMVHALRWLGRDKELEPAVTDYVCRCTHHANEYDLIVFFPCEHVPLVHDGIRSQYQLYQLSIEYMLWGALQIFCPHKLYVMGAGTPHERAADLYRDVWGLKKWGKSNISVVEFEKLADRDEEIIEKIKEMGRNEN